jgi:hypothetical protein
MRRRAVVLVSQLETIVDDLRRTMSARTTITIVSTVMELLLRADG